MAPDNQFVPRMFALCISKRIIPLHRIKAHRRGKMNKTLYELLQVSPSADIDVIDAAYARLRQKHHDNDVISKAIKVANDTLSDPLRRANYDQRFMSRMPSHTGYHGGFSDTGDAWWRSPAFSREIIFVALVAAITLIAISVGSGSYLSYTKHEKDTVVARAVVSNDSRRVDNERVSIDRSMDIQERLADIQKETLERNVELARIEQQRRAAETDAMITHQNERLRMQREQQQFAMWQQQNVEQRVQEDRARILNRERLDRDRRDLCLMERYRYNRVFSC